MYYGLISQDHAIDYAMTVCDVLGHGGTHSAVAMLLETSAQETHLGLFPDKTHYGAGTGLCQIDLIGFEDIQARVRDKHVAKVLEAFGVNVRAVEYRELEFSPLLSFIFCRLFYLLRPEVVPVTVHGRADYWKRHYNTSAGKGSAAEYMESVARVLSGITGYA